MVLTPSLPSIHYICLLTTPPLYHLAEGALAMLNSFCLYFFRLRLFRCKGGLYCRPRVPCLTKHAGIPPEFHTDEGGWGGGEGEGETNEAARTKVWLPGFLLSWILVGLFVRAKYQRGSKSEDGNFIDWSFHRGVFWLPYVRLTRQRGRCLDWLKFHWVVWWLAYSFVWDQRSSEGGPLMRGIFIELNFDWFMGAQWGSEDGILISGV